MLRKNRHWLNSTDVFRILKTTGQKLDQVFKSIQKSNDPMELEKDFADFDRIRYYSFSGLEKLSIELRLILKSQRRKEYCDRVYIVAPPILQDLTRFSLPDSSEIGKAMNYAKNNRDSQKCQVEGVTREDDEQVELVAHHLYDQNNYRFVAAELDNIITISKKISNEFHQWNGGTQQSCTIDDFLNFLELFYPEKHKIIAILYNRRDSLRLKVLRYQRLLPKA